LRSGASVACRRLSGNPDIDIGSLEPSSDTGLKAGQLATRR